MKFYCGKSTIASISLFVILLVAWILLILNKEIFILRITVFFGAIAFSGLFYQSVVSLSDHNHEVLNKSFENARAAQAILNDKAHLFTKRLSSKSTAEFSNRVAYSRESIAEMVESPIAWLTCLAVAAMLAVHPVYLELQVQTTIELKLVAKVFSLSVLQFLLLALCFSGALLRIMKTFKGNKE
ncbi:MAG TPA: hypothetical protein VEC35_04495 [Noviherbaspirillum sp.]|nr:hypothetical protein [Noviherbaspirillum sp.]